MYRIQEFMRERIFQQPTVKHTILPPIAKTNFPETSKFYVPYCDSYMMDRFKNRSTGTTKVNPLPKKQGALTRYKYYVGGFVSTDQFICKTPGRLPTGYVRYSTHFRFRGGTIYNNADVGLIWVYNQVSLGINVTVMKKSRLEKFLWYKSAT